LAAVIRRLARFALCSVLPLAPALASAADIDIKIGDCKSGVTLVARNAPLAKVLQRLSQSLSFRLKDQANPERIINVSMTAPASELVASLLSAEERFMVSHRRDRRCPGQTRISQIWLLPQGASAVAAKEGAARGGVPRATPVTETATPEKLRAYEETARQRKEAYDAYMKEHGKPPPGEEEQEARP
jgi:hypothetical protein